MKCNLFVGQKVVCAPVHSKAHNEPAWGKVKSEYGWSVPIPEQVYTVREIYLDSAVDLDGDPMIGIRLVEIVNPKEYFGSDFTEVGWPHYEFKPATDISLLTQALETA